MEWDFDAAVQVTFAEDLTYAEVAPILDAFAATRIFTVRGARVAWSGPAGGGPEIALIITAVGAAIGGAFLGELGKDAYRAVRQAIIDVVRRLRARSPEERRAVVGLSIHVQDIRICIGPGLHEPAAVGEWTDAWLLERLRRAQALLDEHADGPSDVETSPDVTCDFWVD